MKTLTIVMAFLAFSAAAFAAEGQGCNPGKEKLEAAALSLALINNPEGELSVKLKHALNTKTYIVIVDDNYGLSETVIKTQETSNGFCRIKSITE